MKKLLLGLGTLSLAALPVLTIISCSSTSTTPTIDTEVAKFVTQKSKITNQTAKAAKTAIDAAAAKEVELDKYYTLPKLADGFTYIYTSSVVDTTTTTTLNVTVEITETGNAVKKEAIFAITDFEAIIPTIDTEAEKLTTPLPTLKRLETAAAAKTAIDAALATDANTARLELDKYYEPITTLVNGFSYAYTSSVVDTTTTTTLNVTVTVSGPSGTTPKSFVIKITDFASSTLATEAALLVTQVTKISGETVAAALAKINNDTVLETYYTKVGLADGFTYTYTSGAVDTTTTTTLNVTVTITLTNGSATESMEKVIAITGFTAASTIDTEAEKLTTPLPTLKRLETAEAAKIAIDEALATDANTARLELDKYYEPITTLVNGFSYAYTSSVVDTTTTTLNVTVTVSGPSGTVSKTKVIKITDFASSTLATEAALLVTQVTKISGETAAAALAKIDNATTNPTKDTVLETYYTKVGLADGFTYTYTSGVVDTTTTTTLNVTVTVTLTNGSATQSITHLIAITGFTAAS